jgi:hypothetical protein
MFSCATAVPTPDSAVPRLALSHTWEPAASEHESSGSRVFRVMRFEE